MYSIDIKPKYFAWALLFIDPILRLNSFDILVVPFCA